MPRIIPPPIEGYKPWDMFERIFDRDGLGEALAWWTKNMSPQEVEEDSQEEADQRAEFARDSAREEGIVL